MMTWLDWMDVGSTLGMVGCVGRLWLDARRLRTKV